MFLFLYWKEWRDKNAVYSTDEFAISSGLPVLTIPLWSFIPKSDLFFMISLITSLAFNCVFMA